MASLAQAVSSLPPAASLLTDIDVVEAGVSPDVMTDFLALVGLELQNIYDIIIPARMLTHRRARGENLTRDESDKLARLVSSRHNI